MKIFMFPGQGSQSKGMGADLFDQFDELTNKANEILGYSIKDLCLEDPDNELNQTQFTQPALFVVNALSYYKNIEVSGEQPDYLAGHSLGEFNALLAAECFDFEVGLKLVRKRGELMSQATKGGMAAVLNAPEDKILDLLIKNGLHEISLANFNTPSQIVISGLKDEITKAESVFTENDIKIIVLNTSGAFHSKYMASAKNEFEAFLKEFEYAELKIPVIANCTAVPYENDKIVDTLSNQMISPVRWVESVQYLMGLGDTTFEEIGHGQVLTKLVKRIKDETTQKTDSGAEEKNTKDEVPVKERSGGVSVEDQSDEVSMEEPSDKEPVGESTNDVDGSKQQLDDIKMNGEARKAIAEEKVNAWNEKYPKGTRVKSVLFEDEILETRTEAVVLFGFRAAIYMKDYNGYFDLDEITPYEEARSEAS